MIKINNLIKINAYILGIIAFFSVAFDINILMTLIFVFLFSFAIIKELYFNIHISRVIFNILAIISIVVLFSHATTDTIIYAVIYSLLLLLMIKYLENKEFRDYLQIIVIAFFILAGSALINLSIRFIFITTIFFILVIYQLIFLSFYKNDTTFTFTKDALSNIIKKFILMPVFTLPVTVVIFLIMPRMSYPIFDLSTKQSRSATGFVETVRLGSSSDIYEDNSIVLRIKMPEVPYKALYWRGITLNTFDGNNWSYKEIKNPSKEIVPSNNNMPIKQEVYLNPMGSKYLISLDKPVKIFYSKKLNYQEELNIKTDSNIDKSIHYTAYSIPTPILEQKNINETLYTKLPDIDPNIKKLALKLKDPDNWQTVNNILNYLLKGKFIYSSKDLPTGPKPLSRFLFTHKRGNCEFFASAFAVLSRANNIPTRLISGYKGGDYNDMASYYIIAQKNAHIWVEVYFEGKWIRVDPTPISSNVLSKKNKLLKKLTLVTDTINYYWSIFVINYDFQKQTTLWSHLKNPLNTKKITSFKVLISLIISIAIIILIIFVKKIKKENIKDKKRAIKTIKKLEKKLKKYGFPREKWEPLTVFINKNNLNETTKEQLNNIVTYVMSYFYRDKDLPLDLYKDLCAQLKTIKKI